MILYDIPVRTGRKIDTDTILRLAEDVPTIAGVKDAAGDPAETARLIAAAPEDFEVYSGDDSLNLPFLAVGAVGVISVAAHWTRRALHRELVDAVFKGDMETARTRQRPAAAVVRVREHRRCAEPGAHQGDAPGARAAGRRVPPADGPDAGRPGGPCKRDRRRARTAVAVVGPHRLFEAADRAMRCLSFKEPIELSALRLEDDLDRAVLLLLEHLVGLRRLGQRHVVGGEAVDTERILVGEQRQDVVDPAAARWPGPCGAWICLSNMVSIGSGSVMPAVDA